MMENNSRTSSTTSTERVRGTIGFSIASKLNIQLWFRLLGVFLVLNFSLCTAFTIAAINHSERIVSHSVDMVQEQDWDSTHYWSSFSEVEVSPSTGEKVGLPIPEFLSAVFSSPTVEGTRMIVLQNTEDVSLYEFLDSLQYRVDLLIDGLPYTIVVQLEPMVKVFKTVLVVLLIIQFIMLLRSIPARADMIRETLRPIADLAEKAQTLSSTEGPYTVDEMEALAGTLDEINAARLDTRIELDATQDELKNLATAINSMLDRINASYRSQARFVSDASHELRTPIAAIQGYANLLDRWGKHDEQALQESIDAIKDEAANMKELIEQLLFLARGDNNTMRLQAVRFDLGSLAETVYGETKMIDPGHEYELQTSSVFVLADMGLMKQASRILIDNAMKYTPVGGRILIKVDRNNDYARLTVQDEGIGIPPEAVPHVFDRFYRADESRARATGGTGLGLSIAKWIAERHGGYMEVLSREDLGTRISIVIPASQAQ